jgi:60 kDa SS-A/Ro ribonucleoprotein
MTRYASHVNDRQTSQRQSARADQVQNAAGGFVFAVDKWTRLDRFLVLGAEGGTYYVDEKKHVQGNVMCLRECLSEDGLRVVRRIVEISDAGRAPKNDPAIFALAMAAGAVNAQTRAAALAALPKVCRTGTHLLHFVNDVQNFRGWGRSLVRAVSRWYIDRPLEGLALQMAKYQQRDGWHQRDVLRMAHPRANTPTQNSIFRWTRGKEDVKEKKDASKHVRTDRGAAELPGLLQAFEAIHAADVDVKRAAALIRQNGLPHECVPNRLKSRPEIWEAMLPHMGQTALIRNLAKMTSVGLLTPMGKAARQVAGLLTDSKRIFAGRIHPIGVLLAMQTYASGHGLKGSLSWSPVREIVDALDEAFYLAFQAIEPTGKRYMLALDISGSMGTSISGTSLSCREAAAAMAMATARSEKDYCVVGFTAAAGSGRAWSRSSQTGLTAIPISAKTRLDDAVALCKRLPMGNTDCALPMLHATADKLEVDVFCVYTDNESWAGDVHPFQALRSYREKSGIAAKLVSVAMTATDYSIADPTDAGMLDVVGFDAAVPGVIADFAGAREIVA